PPEWHVIGKCRTPGRGAPVVLEISMSLASPSAIAATASRMTTGAAQLPPIQPVSFPSGVMIAFAPGFADVGRSARTTVAVANGSRRARSSAASSKNAALPPVGDEQDDRATAEDPARPAQIELVQCVSDARAA